MHDGAQCVHDSVRGNGIHDAHVATDDASDGDDGDDASDDGATAVDDENAVAAVAMVMELTVDDEDANDAMANN